MLENLRGCFGCCFLAVVCRSRILGGLFGQVLHKLSNFWVLISMLLTPAGMKDAQKP